MNEKLITNLDISRLSKNIIKNLENPDLSLCLMQEAIAKSLGFNNLRDYNNYRQKQKIIDERYNALYNLKDYIINKITDYNANNGLLKKETRNKLINNKNKNIKLLANFFIEKNKIYTHGELMMKYFYFEEDNNFSIYYKINISEEEILKMCKICRLTQSKIDIILNKYYRNYDLLFSSAVVIEQLLQEDKFL